MPLVVSFTGVLTFTPEIQYMFLVLILNSYNGIFVLYVNN